MRYFIFICGLLGIFSATSCGKESKDKGRDTYMLVAGTYCMNVQEIANTCSCSGPRQFTDPVAVLFNQYVPDGVPSGDLLWFSGGSLTFGGPLDTDGYFSSQPNYGSDPYISISSVTYDGQFSGTNGHMGTANHHETVGPDSADKCVSGEPCHFRIDYKMGKCCNGAAGYNVFVLSGNKNDPGSYTCPANTAWTRGETSFIAHP